MSNRYENEEEPGRWREQDADHERQPAGRQGGSYGIGGPERGYNMGGYGGMSSYERGYKPRSYDRLLDLTERREDEHAWYERDWRGTQGKAPKGYTRSDARIREDVCERLMYSPYDASDVEVTVTNGEVTLSGVVHTRADKWGIEDVAEAVLGVHDVHNQIRLIRGQPQASGLPKDDTGRFHS